MFIKSLYYVREILFRILTQVMELRYTEIKRLGQGHTRGSGFQDLCFAFNYLVLLKINKNVHFTSKEVESLKGG